MPCQILLHELAPDLNPAGVEASSRCFPPVECCRGPRPSQAAKSRASRKVSGGGARTAMAVAISGPLPPLGSLRSSRERSASSDALPLCKSPRHLPHRFSDA